MIDFRCQCRYVFSVPTELAGDLVQCPQCRRLNDVPRMSELSSLEADGLYKVDDAPPPTAEANTVAQIARAFGRDRFDDEGYAIDNRGVFAPQPHAVPAEPLAAAGPRYDPFTGELIQELKIVEPVHEAIPMARPVPRPPRAAPSLFDEPEKYELAALPALLLTPINLFVIGVILFCQFLCQGMVLGFAFNPAVGFFWFIFQGAMIAHFGNVIDETGPTNRQELPVPLRSMEFGEDIFLPLFRTGLSLGICYLPGLMMLITLRDAPPQLAIGFALTLCVLGSLIFPAVWLTAMTSGTVMNLRPDRVWTVIVALGGEYVFTLLVWTLGGTCYFIGVAWVTAVAIGSSPWGPELPSWVKWYTGYAFLAGGIYLLHLLGWQLGTLYRKHHLRFAWILQRFIKDDPNHLAAPTGFAVKRIRQQPPTPQAFPTIEP